MNYSIRLATMADKPAITQLIADSARGLSQDDYTELQIETAIALVYGVDSDLINDQTYFVVEAEGKLVGCGGWSQRKTLFGGDQYANRDTGMLDPAVDAAKIRTFFVHPSWARRGIGKALLARCEEAAVAAGFRALELMSTLPGLKLYRTLGFESLPMIYQDFGGVIIELVPMRKELTK